MSEQRRAAAGGHWAALPHPILELIFQEVWPNDLRSILQLRLVCKEWRDACGYYGGSAWFDCKDNLHLQQACKILPNLGKLSVDIIGACNSVTAISSLSLLSRLRIYNQGATPLSNSSCSFVPLNVKSLDLVSSSRESNFIQNIQSAGFTDVNLECPSFAAADIDALQHLPMLQDLRIGATRKAGKPRTQEFAGALRCGSLIQLTLSNGCLLGGSDVPSMPPQLREVLLEDMTLDERSLCKMATGLPNLTNLDFEECTIERPGTQVLCASSSLRELRVYRSPSILLCVASASLQSLVYGLWWEPVNVPRLASFTALKRLVLLDLIFDPKADMRPLQELNLIELALLDCLGITEALFKPGAFQVLQKLHYDDDFESTVDAYGEIVDFVGFPELLGALAPHDYELAKAVFALPSLVELSGANRFSALEIPEKSLRWQKCCSTSESWIDGIFRKQEVWRKVP